MNSMRLAILLFPLCMSLLFGLLGYFQVFRSVDTFLFDRAHAFAKFTPAEDIVLVAIDEQSFEALGAWPWSRSVHANAIETLSTLGAETIVFDILFSELSQDLDSDLAFANAVQQHGKVVLPMFIDNIRLNGPVIEIQPTPLLSSVAAAMGHVHIDCDNHGICRSVYLKEGVGDAYWPHITLAAAELNEENILLRGERPAHQQTLSPKLIYRDFHNYLIFPRYQPQYQTISYIDLLNGKVDMLSLTGKTIFIGATSKGLNDMVLTPAGKIPGLVANAMIYQTLKANAWIKQADPLFAALLTSVFGFLFLFYFSKLSPWAFLLAAATMIAALTVGTMIAIGKLRYWFPASSLFILLMLYYPLWNWFRLQIALNFLKNHQAKLNLEYDDRQSLFAAITASPTLTPNHNHNKTRRQRHTLEVVTDTIRNLNQLNDTLKINRFLVDQTLSRLQEGVIVTDTSGNIILANALAKQYLPVDSKDVFRLLNDYYTPAQQRVPHQLIGQSIQNGLELDTFVTEEIKSTQANQQEQRYLLCQARKENFHTTINQVQFSGLFIFTLTDITQIKHLERSRLDTLRFLSHDLRSPMVSSLALIESIKAGNNQDSVASNLEKLERYAKRNLHYSEKIIQLGRAEELDESKFSICDAHAIVDNAFANCIDYAKARDMKLKIEREDKDFWFKGDMDAIVRAVENLITNAIKYSHAGDIVTLRLGEDAQQSNQLIIAVEDHGPGLSREQQAQAFQRFGQVAQADLDSHETSEKNTFNTSHPARSPERKSGVGLGLYFVTIVMQKHHGQIELESSPGKGCSFRLKLPLTE
ncbi:Sensor protein kinase WalK [Thalassocella blandensis]|nr:Sensor protein kinase WalK [Thalassocella blandensis]